MISGKQVERRARRVTDFRRLIETLSTADVDYILVGGVATTVHGSVRLTADIDIVYARDRGNRPTGESLESVRALSARRPKDLESIAELEAILEERDRTR